MRSLFCAVVATAVFCASSANAQVLLNVDLDPSNLTITISSTGGLSAATISGSDTTGFYLENFFGGATSAVAETFLFGDLTSALNTSDGTPNLFRGGTTDPGLNVFSYTDDPFSDFTAGTVAFSGTASWGLSQATFDDIAGGATSGNIYFPADTVDDIPGATLLGTYEVSTVPEPSTITLVGLVGLVATFRRKRA